MAEDELRSRLHRRANYDSERIDRKVAFSARLREEADFNLNTAGMSIDEVVTAVEQWLRNRIDANVGSTG